MEIGYRKIFSAFSPCPSSVMQFRIRMNHIKLNVLKEVEQTIVTLGSKHIKCIPVKEIKLICVMVLLLLCGCRKPEPVNKAPLIITTNISFNQNPGGNWQVGYSSDTTLALDKFMLNTYTDTSNIIGMWHPFAGQAGYYPYVGQNRGNATHVDTTGSWAVRPGEFAMEASATGQYSILRFIAPATGKYVLSATFEGVHSKLSTDVHILLNETHLLDDSIEGYGGDPLFHAIEGTHPSSSFQDTLVLQQNDILTFAVGYGPNKTHYNDTTGLLLMLAMLENGF